MEEEDRYQCPYSITGNHHFNSPKFPKPQALVCTHQKQDVSTFHRAQDQLHILYSQLMLTGTVAAKPAMTTASRHALLKFGRPC